MAEVNLSIHGKSYGISCDDGQEGRVVELGRYVDDRLKDISTAGAATNESHMLVLAALVLADEIYELRQSSNENIPSEQQTTVNQGLPEEEEQMLLSAIGNLTERVDTISERIEKL
jgi:cell division protein ZapA